MRSRNLRKILLFISRCIFFLLVNFGGYLQAQDLQTGDGWKFPDFSATQVFPSRRADIAMKVYRSGSSVRVERSRAMSTLYMTSASKVYNLTVYPDKSRQCVSMNPEQARMLPSPLELIQGKILKRTTVGTEEIDGHRTKIEDVVVLRAGGKRIESRVWEAEDLNGIPVKIESNLDGLKLQALYRDILVGAPDRALFATPDRCTPFEKMGQVAEARELK
jgi:hypothetical protein